VGFLLPAIASVPTGGVKVVFEYANQLAARGWTVHIAFPHLLAPDQLSRARASRGQRLRTRWSFLRRRLLRRHRPGWFRLDPRVGLHFTPSAEPGALPPAAAWVATAWRTAPWVALTAGARLYLVQSLETWDGPEEEVRATWRLPLRKVVIARYLEEYARGLGERSDYVPNGLDFEALGIDVPLGERSAPRVLMLFHDGAWKGSADGLAALEIARQTVPALQATLFGVPRRPAWLPAWIGYERRPTPQRLRALYNQAAVFLSPSRVEGWPLPPAEALACGCALVCTDIGGHREYADDGATALLAPPGDPAALGARLVRALRDPTLRLSLARAGNARIRGFTWARATDALEGVLRDALLAQPAKR